MGSGPKPEMVYSEPSAFDRRREMNDEEIEEYYEAANESEGFDVPYFPDSYAFGIITPMTSYPEFPLPEEVTESTLAAIQHYNHHNGTNLELVKIVKANNRAASGIIYYITFEAKEVGAESPTTTFQARVLLGVPHSVNVELCRPKPKPKPSL